ncbi:MULTISPECIES: hypothetical protein [Streptomyces]|uniref:Alpha-glucoside transport system substrate-binding protein n=1 Tax=Streptomyces caniscabiei TaxID=2746961 RepID=A0ABU4MHQ1_9ACTN|nr:MULTISPECIES: hypothetical protein [Streptomyces]MBE4736197.1 hypothetical protein [Streptomyces caniscabiei]MBE4755675.1 hypothetical protein [Streptomyces caniscabiei]MBE4774227.1 hypothetical protein [Streptomyces caniscabiei]MBE4785836.1 hypothetical protein [Streptomyces caniscabiei]MBE4793857.1 hypothetical protein [Streptomyces caniscabiei]
MRALGARLARCALALGLLLGLSGCAEEPRRTVTIMVPWGGAEFTAFQSIISAYDAHHDDIEVRVQATRALDQHLDAAAERDYRPDLVVLPSLGSIRRYAKVLRPIKEIPASRFSKPFRPPAKGDGLLAVPVKVDVKSLIWYDPAVVGVRPVWRSAVRAERGAPGGSWCLGMESGATSGWPGADWIADVLLSGDEGKKAYEEWLHGRLLWASPKMKKAWREWGAVVRDSSPDAPVKNFPDVAADMSGVDRTCDLAHGALGALRSPTASLVAENYAFVAPAKDVPLQVSADYIAMFTENADAKDLVAHLVTTTTQQRWVGGQGSSAFSAVRGVMPPGNPPDAQRLVAGILQDEARTLCFSAADTMDPNLAAAFYRAVVDYYVHLRTPQKEAVLAEHMKTLDRISADLKPTERPDPTSAFCTTP